MTRKKPGVIYEFDDIDEIESEVHFQWGRFALKLLEIYNESKKENKNGECFNVSGGLRKRAS